MWVDGPEPRSGLTRALLLGLAGGATKKHLWYREGNTRAQVKGFRLGAQGVWKWVMVPARCNLLLLREVCGLEKQEQEKGAGDRRKQSPL